MSYSRPGGCKGLGSTAVGYWGRDIYIRNQTEQSQARMRALLQDQLQLGGLRCALWTGVTTGDQCSCYNETVKQADRKCGSCYGTGFAPGYEKFGYQTFWMTGFDTGVTLHNVKITDTFKSAKVVLEDSATSGYIESTAVSFTRTFASVWEYNLISFLRDSVHSSVTAYYSISSGPWTAISSLASEVGLTGTIKFRVELTRTSTSILTPYFEIVRARYATLEVDDTGRWGPWILALTNRPFRKKTKSDWGDVPQQESTEFWTAGLAMFDSSITIGSTDELVTGPNVFIEILDGVLVGNRYVTSSWQTSDPLGYVVITQNFKTMFADPVGPYSLIW